MKKKIKKQLEENEIRLLPEYRNKYRQALLDYGINPDTSFVELMSTYSGEFSGSEGTMINVAEDLLNGDDSYNLSLQEENGLDRKFLQLLSSEYDDYLLYDTTTDSVVLIEGMNDDRLKEEDYDREWDSFDDFLDDFFEEE